MEVLCRAGIMLRSSSPCTGGWGMLGNAVLDLCWLVALRFHTFACCEGQRGAQPRKKRAEQVCSEQ